MQAISLRFVRGASVGLHVLLLPSRIKVRSEAIEVNRRYPCWNDRRSSAMSGYFAVRKPLRHADHWSFEFEHGTSNIERAISNRLMDIEPEISNSKNRTSVIDVIAHDPKTGEVVLVMNEPNEWDDSDEQLLSLQERFNAYVSFLLDGEMTEAHPELAAKPTRIELRCAHMPDARALELLGHIHDQLAFQEIKLEVVVRSEAAGQ